MGRDRNDRHRQANREVLENLMRKAR
jgi:hypothetical protein